MAPPNARAAPPAAPDPHSRIAPGTIIYTLDGALPVEYLNPGDRIITRAGMRILRDISSGAGGFALHFDQPEIIYADGTELLAA